MNRYDQSNFQRYVIGGLLIISKGEPMAIMMGSVAGLVLEYELQLPSDLKVADRDRLGLA